MDAHSETEPVEGVTFCVDYAHRVCEEHLQEQHTKTEAKEALRKVNFLPYRVLDALRDA